MKTYLKSITFAVGVLAMGLSFSANAQSPVFHSILKIKNVSDPQIFVGRDRTQYQPITQNTFKIGVKHSDYFFKVKYQHEGKNKEAACPISGAPASITAIINPQKEGREACTTEES